MTAAVPFDDLELGPAAEDEVSQILALINVVQPHVPWSEEYLRWQYLDSPAGPARLYVARGAGRVISLYAGVVHRMQVREAIVDGWMVQDVMTDPAYRGRGLLHRLGELCLADLRAAGAIGYAFPNNQSERSFLRLGWHDWGPVPWWSAEVARGVAGDADPRPLESFDDDATRTWERSALGFGVRRDAAYLAWRYRKPGQTYHRFAIDGRAVLVLKVYGDAGARKVHVCELFTTAEDETLMPRLLGFVHRWAADAGASTLTAWMPPAHRYARHLEAAGFRAGEAPSRMVVITSPPALEPFAEERGNWYLAQGDSDIY